MTSEAWCVGQALLIAADAIVCGACSDLHDACMRIARAFGAERCVWGSDYPNGLWTPKVSYAEHLKIFTEVLPFREQEREAVLGSTPKRLWFPNL